MNVRPLRLAALFALLVSASAWAQSKKVQEQQVFNVKFEMDPILAVPGVWDLTPEKLEEMCTIQGFKTPPQFKWLTQNHDGARFSRKPYGNVNVDLTMFGGQV